MSYDEAGADTGADPNRGTADADGGRSIARTIAEWVGVAVDAIVIAVTVVIAATAMKIMKLKLAKMMFCFQLVAS